MRPVNTTNNSEIWRAQYSCNQKMQMLAGRKDAFLGKLQKSQFIHYDCTIPIADCLIRSRIHSHRSQFQIQSSFHNLSLIPGLPFLHASSKVRVSCRRRISASRNWLLQQENLRYTELRQHLLWLPQITVVQVLLNQKLLLEQARRKVPLRLKRLRSRRLQRRNRSRLSSGSFQSEISI